MSWIKMDTVLRRTEFDKPVHFAYSFVAVILLSAIGIYFKLSIHVVRLSMIAVAILGIIKELWDWLKEKEFISIWDLIMDACGILLAGWSIHVIESL